MFRQNIFNQMSFDTLPYGNIQPLFQLRTRPGGTSVDLVIPNANAINFDNSMQYQVSLLFQ